MFVDECGMHTSMTRLRARAPRGERAYGKVPRNRGKNTTLIASMTHEGMGPSMAVVGSTTKAVFEVYVEEVLAPSLLPGQVVVLDNLGAHKSERVRELVEARGCELLFLPAYSPDFSPIEEAFSKIKALLRKALPPATAGCSLRPSAGLSRPSRRGTRWAGSPTAATRSGLIVHEHRCETIDEEDDSVEFESGTAETTSSHVMRDLARGTLEEAASGHSGTSGSPSPRPHAIYTKVICHSSKRRNWPGRDRLNFLAGQAFGFENRVEMATKERHLAGALTHYGAREGVK
ncbi:MAG: transposase [Rubrobacter sp.]|nr:transposase [Rubrobacter sp.]